MSQDTILLPPKCQARFIGEGAANVVFHVEDQRGQPAFPGYLLRVPKAETRAFSYRALQEYWEKTVAPLFEDRSLVKQSLVSLNGSGIIPALNAILEEMEHTRRKDFRGSRVAEDSEYGMLVEDMRRRDASDLIVEFKPKWLSQSPAAPPTASRCRNCAREAYRASKDGTSLGSGGRYPLCPLKLLHARELPCNDDQCGEDNCRDPSCEVGTMAIGLLSKSGDEADVCIISKYKGPLSRWIRSNGLLPLLRSLQVACDTGLQSDQELGMTLRDCTCFVRLSLSGRPVEAKLGDLDRKNGAAKREYWEEMERKLAQGGYYEGNEVPRQRTACWLERA